MAEVLNLWVAFQSRDSYMFLYLLGWSNQPGELAGWSAGWCFWSVDWFEFLTALLLWYGNKLSTLVFNLCHSIIRMVPADPWRIALICICIHREELPWKLFSYYEHHNHCFICFWLQEALPQKKYKEKNIHQKHR